MVARPRGGLTARWPLRATQRAGAFASISPGPSDPDRTPGYLPALDGIRAIAVLAVVLFHAGVGWLRGGFLGVEVFFVISGYIITRGLLGEWDLRRNIGLSGFWLRRARRLLPAVFALFAAVTAWTVAFDPGSAAQLRGDLLASGAYVMNWHLVLDNQSYFSSFERPPALQHLWSLAIEEQFYVAWPVLLLAGLRVLPRPALLILIVMGAIASALTMALLYLSGTGVSDLYYRTDTRASGLLFGAALAVAMGERRAIVAFRTVLNSLGAASALILSAGILWLNEDRAALYVGGFGLMGLATAGLIASTMGATTWTSGLLGNRALRWVGLRSYAIYLWHWPIMVHTRQVTDVPLHGPALLLLQVTITLVLADLSYRYIERPVRRGALGRGWNAGGAWIRERRWRRLASCAGFAAAAGTSAGIALVILVRADPSPGPQSFNRESVRLSPSREIDLYRLLGLMPPGVVMALSTNAGNAVQANGDGLLASVPSSGSSGIERSVSSSFPRGTRPRISVAPPAPARRITALGDSVMLGAAVPLAAAAGGIAVDAAVGRQVSAAIELMEMLKVRGELGDVVVLHIGNNGTFTRGQFDEIMQVAGPQRHIVFLTLHVPRDWERPNNDVIRNGVERYRNASLVDWHAAAEDHPDIFWDDHTHLRPEGALLYVNLIASDIAPDSTG